MATLPGLPVGSDKSMIQKGDVVIDFTVADATAALLPEVVRYRKAMVIGTTGFSAEQEAKIAQAAKEIPIVISFNMSLGVNVFFQSRAGSRQSASGLCRSYPGDAPHEEERRAFRDGACRRGD